jgi:hypothetical protein
MHFTLVFFVTWYKAKTVSLVLSPEAHNITCHFLFSGKNTTLYKQLIAQWYKRPFWSICLINLIVHCARPSVYSIKFRDQ